MKDLAVGRPAQSPLAPTSLCAVIKLLAREFTIGTTLCAMIKLLARELTTGTSLCAMIKLLARGFTTGTSLCAVIKLLARVHHRHLPVFHVKAVG